MQINATTARCKQVLYANLQNIDFEIEKSVIICKLLN